MIWQLWEQLQLFLTTFWFSEPHYWVKKTKNGHQVGPVQHLRHHQTPHLQLHSITILPSLNYSWSYEFLNWKELTYLEYCFTCCCVSPQMIGCIRLQFGKGIFVKKIWPMQISWKGSSGKVWPTWCLANESSPTSFDTWSNEPER